MLTFSRSKESLKAISENPGVYIFRNIKKEAIYVGKAKNLKARISSYFALNLLSKTKEMFAQSSSFSIIKVNSEMEALILEAKLVHDLLPKYNSSLKDDKSPLYILITSDTYPRIILVRKTSLDRFSSIAVFGPFLSSTAVKTVLSLIRKVFPFSTHLPQKRNCIYREIGLCDPCPSEIETTKDKILAAKYKSNIKKIKLILSGKIGKVTKELYKEVTKLSIQEKFEEALVMKNKINHFERLLQSPIGPQQYLNNPNLLEDVRSRELYDLKTLLSKVLKIKQLTRIECFDVAHLYSSFPTASMVTFINAEANKDYYRHFRLSTLHPDDTKRIEEVLIRRIKHFDDWGKPDLVIVDGGKPQVGVASKILRKSVPVIGLAKRYETIVIKLKNRFLQIKLKPGPALNLLQRLRDESHRFSQRYHHKLYFDIIK